MATIRLKRRGSPGSTGAPASLTTAEPAWNDNDDILYLGKGDNGSGQATSVVAIGGKGAFLAKADTPSMQASQDGSIGGTWGSLTFTLANTVAAGTYYKVTVDPKGRVTAGVAALVAADIPSLAASKISDFDTQVRTSRLDQMAAPTAAVALNSQRLTGVADPVSAQDAATKNYVDLAMQGLSAKASVRVASAANQALSGGTAFPTIDGIVTAAGDRVLLKNQTTGSQNGIYVVGGTSTAWTLTRATDFDAAAEVQAGAYFFVEEGSTQADTGWVLTTDGTITVGTTSLAFVQFSGAGQIAAGAGLTKSGNTLDVVGTANRIVANADSIDIASTYAGQTSITTVGTIDTGTWDGGTF